MQLEIDTGNTTPKKQQPCHLPFAVNEVAQQFGCHNGSRSDTTVTEPKGQPSGFCKKERWNPSFYVDYCIQNAVTKRDTHPLPRIDDLIDQLIHGKFFSSLDLAEGYWHVHPNSQPKTAFVT